MGRYENIIVINPDCAKEEEDELMKRITANIEKTGAVIAKLDDWGVRKLAYPIKKKDRGHYFFFFSTWRRIKSRASASSTGPWTIS